VDSIGVDPGPNRKVLIGTEVYLDARILETTITKDCESDTVDITETAEVLDIQWEFLPPRGNVGVLINGNTLSPNFKVEMEGPYWLRVTGTARFVKSTTGKTKTQAFAAEVLINSRLSLVNLKVKTIEVTQAIQTTEAVKTGMTSGAVPLIALKDTVVRVYGDITGPGMLSEADVDGSLRLIREEDGQEFPIVKLNPKQRIVVEPFPLETLRSSQESSLNFLIPAKLAQGTVRLIARINPDCRILEETCDDNDKEVRITFRKTRPLNLHYLFIRFKSAGQPVLTVKDADFAPLPNYLRRVYPVSGIKLTYHGPELEVNYPLDTFDGFFCSLGLCEGWNRLLQDIQDLTGCGNWDCPGDYGPDPHFYGAVPLNTPTGNVRGLGEFNLAGDPEPTAAGIADCPTANIPNLCRKNPGEEIGGEVMAMEIAHNYGRGHADSGAGETSPSLFHDDDYRPIGGNIGDWGFDTAKRQLIDLNAYDFMTYRSNDPVPMWVGPYTYRGLSDEFPTSEAIVVDPGQNPLGPKEFLLVSGLVTPTGSTLRPMYRMMRNADQTIPPPGHFSIDLWDEANNRLLNSISFEPPLLSVHSDEQLRIFRGYILWHEDTTAIILRRGSDVLQRIGVTPHTPFAMITDPVVGTTLPDEVTIKWTAVDADRDPLTAMVQYSKDGGQNWLTVGTSIRSSEFTFDMSRLPGSTSAFLRVLVTDGVNTGTAQVGPFAVPFKNPTAQIMPLAVSEFTAGEPVILNAYASDPEEGGLTGDNSVSWESDLDGFLGTGTTLATSDLSPGLHTITFQARDSGGMTGTDQIGVQILPQIPELDQAALSVKAVNQAQNQVDVLVNLSNSGRTINTFTPLSATYPKGTQLRIEAPAVIEAGTSRLVFQRWKVNESPVGIKPVLFMNIDRNVDLVAEYAQSVALLCDIDDNKSVDRNDINAIFAMRNTPAAAGDPRDVDGDGKITVNDARICTLRCTKPRCAP
jgi:hypothetical protein